MSASTVAAAGPPFLIVLLDGGAAAIQQRRDRGDTVIELAGCSMQDTSSAKAEMAKAFVLPSNYPTGLDVLDEAINDLDWLPRRDGTPILVVVRDSELVLDQEGPSASWVRDILGGAVGEWANPPDSRRASAFEVWLLADSASAGVASRRWSAR